MTPDDQSLLARLERSASELGRDDPTGLFADLGRALVLTALLVGVPWLLAWLCVS